MARIKKTCRLITSTRIGNYGAEEHERFVAHCRKNAKHIEMITEGLWNSTETRVRALVTLLNQQVITSSTTTRLARKKNTDKKAFNEFYSAMKRLAEKR